METMNTVLPSVHAHPTDVAAARAGDDIVAEPDVVMDRGFTAPAPPEVVWPWLIQLGKHRAGWYLPAAIERVLPRSRRAARRLHPAWQNLHAGDVIPDYGGRDATFEVAILEPPKVLVYQSHRGDMKVSWAITLTPAPEPASTRVHLRLRLGPVRRPWLATTGGELLDVLTIAGLAAGLRERLQQHT
jgi:hypothetical protein